MTEPTRRALLFAHEPEGVGGQIEVQLLKRGYQVDTHVVTLDYEEGDVAAPWPENWREYDLLVPMGSVRSLTRKDEIASWIHDELDLLREAHEADIAILGVCFGGQLLADALGGSVEPAPVNEIGWFKIDPVGGKENPVGPGPWFQWHHDRFNPPATAEVLAENENATQMFRMGRSVGTQFHPEVDAPHLEGFLSGATDEYLNGEGVYREEMMADIISHTERNTKQCHALVDWFLDEVVASSS